MDKARSDHDALDAPSTHDDAPTQLSANTAAQKSMRNPQTQATTATSDHPEGGVTAGPSRLPRPPASAAAPPVATSHSADHEACQAGAADPASAAVPGGAAALGRGGLLRAATTLAGVSAAASELRLAVRAHFEGLVDEMRRLRALNEALAEKCEAQAQQAAAVATFAQDVAAAAVRADSGEEEDILQALRGLDATLADIEAELDCLEAQQAQQARTYAADA